MFDIGNIYMQIITYVKDFEIFCLEKKITNMYIILATEPYEYHSPKKQNLTIHI